MIWIRNDFTPLPSVSLGPSGLKQLETMISELLHKERITVTISREGIEQMYDSFDEMLTDKLAPPLVRSFELEFESEGGRGRITADSSQGDYHRLYLDGYLEWCEHIQTQIEKFMEKKKNRLRTKFSKRSLMAPVSVLSSIVAGHFFITISPLDIFYPAPQRIPLLYFFYIISATVFFGVTFRHYLFPYVYWNLQGHNATHRYVRSMWEVIGLVGFTLLSLPVLSFFS